MLVVPTALFVILSSSPVYRLTNSVLPTQRYGAPTSLGLLVHAAIFAVLLALVSPGF